jgi:polysaccharide deacetylase family protein (PEP-CTERM system associated)
LEKTNGIFTIDVEEYYQVEGFSQVVGKNDWERYPDRVEEPTARLLDLLEAHDVRGTFFVLGWLAERNPALVRRIVASGHEIASHGYDHTMITKLTPAQFRRDVRMAREILQDVTGREVTGYRAPTFSIVERSSCAYSILAEEGYRYSSSVFPFRHDRYGWPEFGEKPKKVVSGSQGDLWEVPLSVGYVGPIRLPFGGGGYLRIYPFFLTKWLIASIRKNGEYVLVYIHPWELDPDQPVVPAPLLRRVRHRIGIRSVEEKIGKLLGMASFRGVARFLEEYEAGA